MPTPAPPATIVIFGAAGDLTQRLLMPSIYDLEVAGLLDPATRFIGADHNERDAAAWQREIGDALHRFANDKGAEFHGTIDERVWSSLAGRMDYVRVDFSRQRDFQALAERLRDAANVLFYLAVSPRFFAVIPEALAQAGLLRERDGAFRRIVIEKPFGHDTASARELGQRLRAVASEGQLYRIDHFLGKEAVRGMEALRFANRWLDAILQRDAVSHVQITAAETVGVEERGAFYESTGALRDMVPNHLFSLLTTLAMDAPAADDADAIRDAKTALLRAIAPLDPADAVRGQYEGYRHEDRVAPDSRTETYVALRVGIENSRWRGVPFYLRTGKKMSAHVTTIAVTLRPRDGAFADRGGPHVIVLGIDPQRGLRQRFVARAPGVATALAPVTTGFRYDQAFRAEPSVGYEPLIDAALRGDQRLFQRDDMIAAEWAAVQPVLDAWSSGEPERYAAGSDGPPSAERLLTDDGVRWYPVAPLDELVAAL